MENYFMNPMKKIYDYIATEILSLSNLSKNEREREFESGKNQCGMCLLLCRKSEFTTFRGEFMTRVKCKILGHVTNEESQNKKQINGKITYNQLIEFTGKLN